MPQIFFRCTTRSLAAAYHMLLLVSEREGIPLPCLQSVLTTRVNGDRYHTSLLRRDRTFRLHGLRDANVDAQHVPRYDAQEVCTRDGEGQE